MKTRSFLAGLLALAGLLGAPLCARAMTLVVTNLADSGPGTLRAAIAIANTNAGDTITFAINGTITLASGLLISNNVAIAGPGPTHLVLEGNGQHHSIFALYLNTNITDNLSGLTIENGVGGHGGGILNNSTLVVSNCVITHNTTLSGNTGYLGEGGGVWNNGVLTLTACTVSSNSAPNYGGGIFNNSGGTLTLNNCTLSGNSAALTGGGGVWNDGVLTLTACTLSGNSTPGRGGGIYNYVGALTLNNCTLSGNSTGTGDGIGSGGGIYNFSALTISNCTLSDNSSTYEGGGITDNSSGTTVNNCTLSGNSASFSGGGIQEEGIGNFTLDNCTLSGNSVTNGYGGGIYTISGTNTLNNCTLSDNSASSGGGIYQDITGMTILTNTIVAGNTATTNSPDIYALYYAQITAVNSLTSGNPLLAPLGNYGGPTQTMPPLAGSPAIDAGDDSVTSFLTTDQRGYPRKSGAHVDIGAVEAQYAPANNPPLLLGSTFPTGAGGNHSFQFTFTNVPNADFTVLGTTNLALPLTDWILIGNAAQNPPGQYQFTDPGATNDPQRFYQVVSP